MTEAPRLLPLSSLIEWKENPRRTHSTAKHDELVESIRAVGLLQPLLVRPVGDAFEVIAGNRRWRAMQVVDVDADVPCVVRDLDDAAAVMAAIAENGDRDGLTPMDEARAYGRLRDSGLEQSEIAARVGKAEQLVRSRLRLLDLPECGQAAVEAGHLSLGGALLIAQLESADERLDVLKAFRLDSAEQQHEEPITKARIRLNIENRARELARAPFNILADDLGAAPCTSCPKRSAAQSLLFGIDVDDTCLDASCWKAKQSTAADRVVAAAREAGREVLEGADAKLFSNWPPQRPRLVWNAKFVDVDDKVTHREDSPTWSKLLEEHPDVATVVVIDPVGNARTLLSKSAAEEIQPDEEDEDDGVGRARPGETPEQKAAREEKQRKWNEEREAEKAARAAKVAKREREREAVLERLPGAAPVDRLRALAFFAVLSNDDAVNEAIVTEDDEEGLDEAQMFARLRSMAPAALERVIFKVLMQCDYVSDELQDQAFRAAFDALQGIGTDAKPAKKPRSPKKASTTTEVADG